MSNDQQAITAGFFVRLIAYCVDLFIVSIVLGIIKAPFAIVELIAPDSILVKDWIFTYSFKDVLFYLLQAAYFIIMTYTTGTTIGKAIFHLKVVNETQEKPSLLDIIFRETIGRFLSTTIFYVGYFIIGFNNSCQGLHDMLSDTRVVYHFKHNDAVQSVTVSQQNNTVINEIEVVEPTTNHLTD